MTIRISHTRRQSSKLYKLAKRRVTQEHMDNEMSQVVYNGAVKEGEISYTGI